MELDFFFGYKRHWWIRSTEINKIDL